jgi:mono/diheme cytochrome c family protein
MNAAKQPGRPRRYAFWVLGAVVAMAVCVFSWIAFAPRPTDFAGGERVALADYHGEDPTGVPPELKAASVLERGEYLTRAADCAVCHTANNGAAYAGGRAFVLPFGTDDKANMPAFGAAYSDYEIANVANYVTARFGARRSAMTARQVAQLRHAF